MFAAAPIWDQWDQGRALHQRGSVLLAILANDVGPRCAMVVVARKGRSGQ